VITIASGRLDDMLVVLGFGAVIWLVALWSGRYDNTPLFDGGEPAEEVVKTVDCTYCDVEIVPETDDGDRAFECRACGNGWHHYDCAHNCIAYLDDVAADQAVDAARDARAGA
jgi:hypothetical protein